MQVDLISLHSKIAALESKNAGGDQLREKEECVVKLEKKLANTESKLESSSFEASYLQQKLAEKNEEIKQLKTTQTNN